MLDGIMLLWFSLTVLSVLFVAIDIQRTLESPVLKWGLSCSLPTPDRLARFCSCWAAASPCLDCTIAVWQCAGDKCLARPCTAGRVTG